MARSIEEIYQSMTDDQKKRARSLKSPEEVLAFAREEGFELTDEQLESVAGGWDVCPHFNDPDRDTEAS